MAIAVFNPPPGGSAAFTPNAAKKVVGIQLNTGNNVSPFWTIFGKVVVTSGSSSSEISVTAELLAVAPPASPALLDTTTVTIPGNGAQSSVSLEGVLQSPATAILPACVEISCTTSLAASAQFARLIAISVDPAFAVTC